MNSKLINAASALLTTLVILYISFIVFILCTVDDVDNANIYEKVAMGVPVVLFGALFIVCFLALVVYTTLGIFLYIRSWLREKFG